MIKAKKKMKERLMNIKAFNCAVLEWFLLALKSILQSDSLKQFL